MLLGAVGKYSYATTVSKSKTHCETTQYLILYCILVKQYNFARAMCCTFTSTKGEKVRVSVWWYREWNPWTRRPALRTDVSAAAWLCSRRSCAGGRAAASFATPGSPPSSGSRCALLAPQWLPPETAAGHYSNPRPNTTCMRTERKEAIRSCHYNAHNKLIMLGWDGSDFFGSGRFQIQIF